MESSEHIAVGNAIQLDHGTGARIAAASRPLVSEPVRLYYGEIVALADFYGTPDLRAISSKPEQAQRAFGEAWTTLVRAKPQELEAILAVIHEEQAMVAEATRNGEQPSSAFARMGDSLELKWNEATGGAAASSGELAALLDRGRYLALAVVNMDHFGKDAVITYAAGHAVAMRRAASLYGSDLAEEDQQQRLCQAYFCNAFADHFLSDLFSAGHLRTPRRPLYNVKWTAPLESGQLAHLMHDEDNEGGLRVANSRGESWLAYGDGRELDDSNKENFRRATEAVQTSADEIIQAATTGRIAEKPAALQLIPNLEMFVPKPIPGGKNQAPLFWADSDGHDPLSGDVYRRGGSAGDWHNKNNYDYSSSSSWSQIGMCASTLLPT